MSCMWKVLLKEILCQTPLHYKSAHPFILAPTQCLDIPFLSFFSSFPCDEHHARRHEQLLTEFEELMKDAYFTNDSRAFLMPANPLQFSLTLFTQLLFESQFFFHKPQSLTSKHAIVTRKRKSRIVETTLSMNIETLMGVGSSFCDSLG